MASALGSGGLVHLLASPRRWQCSSSSSGNGAWAAAPRRSPAVATMADGKRDSLDHLQRAASKLQQQPPSPSPAPAQQPSPTGRRAVQIAPPLGWWDRFPTARTVQQMMETMERIMEDPFAYSGATYPSSPADDSSIGGGYRRGRTPWEIKEGKGDYKMRFDMPGMTREDVKVTVDDSMLVIRAEKPAKGEEGGDGEETWPPRSYGRYNSKIVLPDNVQVEKISAEVKDGVLYVTIPKIASSSKVLDIAVK